MPKKTRSEELQEIWDYMNRKQPSQYDRYRSEWLADEDTQWPGSFERWGHEQIQEEVDSETLDSSN